jgi:hypothetical protein
LIFQQFVWTKANGYNPVVDVNAYREMLTSLFIDCPQIHEKINKLPYEQDRIIEIVKQYLDCKSLGIKNADATLNEKVSKAEAKNKLQFYLLLGGALTSYKMTHLDRLLDYGYSLSPTIGIALNQPIGRNFGRWNIFRDISYRTFRGNQLPNVPVNGFEKKFNLSVLRFTPQMRLKILPRKMITPFLNIGYVVGLRLAADELLLANEWKSLQFGNIVFGAGVQHKKLNVELRYENIGSTNIYNSSTHSFLLLASYRIGN